MKINAKLISACILGAAILPAAQAQVSKTMGLSVRAGVFFPTNSDARAEGKNWFIGGADYRLNSGALGGMAGGPVNSISSISVDYYNKGDFQNLPVLLNVTTRQNELYYTMGAGIAFAQIPNGSGGRESKNGLAYAVAIGMNFEQGKSPLFIEGRYYGSSRSELNGFAVMLGIRL
ncbi:MAG: hypothetical protein JSS72_12205 [Armatimonadetes bacterium]|nr:hypothetical protein [Armatimonadota bacterium]